MQDDLAEQLIAANEEEQNQVTQEDELGLPIPQTKDARAQYNYMVARAFVINPHLYTRNNRKELWNEHTKIRGTLEDIVRLTKWPKNIPKQGLVYIYDKLREVAPQLDEDVIAITPTLAWDMVKQELIDDADGFNVISDW